MESLCAECQEMAELIKCNECREYYCVYCYDFENRICKGCKSDIENMED